MSGKGVGWEKQMGEGDKMDKKKSLVIEVEKLNEKEVRGS